MHAYRQQRAAPAWALALALAASCGHSGGHTVSQETTATVSGLATMNNFAASEDGAWIIASGGINQTTGVAIIDVKHGTTELQPDAWMPTDQAPFVFRGGALVDVTRGDSYALEPDPRYERTNTRTIIRGVAGTGVARVVSATGGQWSVVELYDAATRKRVWKNELPAGQTVSGLAISPDGRSVVLSISVDAGRVTPHIDALVALDGTTGHELWRQSSTLDRAAADGPDMLFFSTDGGQIVLRAYEPDRGPVAEIRSASDGSPRARVALENETQAGTFDDSMHAGFDGKHLWFFRFHISYGGGAHTAVLPSKPVGRTTTCTYAVYAVEGSAGKKITASTDASGIHKALVGDGSASDECDVLAVLPTRAARVAVLRSLGGDRLGVTVRDVAPGG